MDRADEHRRIAGEFTKTVEGIAPAAWDNPAPPEGWVARDAAVLVGRAAHRSSATIASSLA